MKVETRFEPEAFAEAGFASRAVWVAAGLVFVAILALYWRTVADMVMIWVAGPSVRTAVRRA